MEKLDENQNTPIVINLRIAVPIENQKKFIRFLRDAVPFYQTSGGIFIKLFRSIDDPTKLIEVVEYENRDSFEKDQIRVENNVIMKNYLDKWRSLLVGDIAVEVYEEITDEIKK